MQEKRASSGNSRGLAAARRWLRDLAEEVALVARDKRDLLLRIHRYRLRREDLEDCYSQATLELLAQVRQGGSFTSRLHVGNALELRFLSRVHDRRRALSGRSPMQAALEGATALAVVGDAGIEVVDRSASVEALVLQRHELRTIGNVARQLTSDQRLVLGSQLSGEMLPYGPGGHPDPRGALEEDCSSTVNYVLYRSGVRAIDEITRENPLAQDYVKWGVSGPGRWVTIYATTSPTNHTFMTIAGLRLDTSHNGTDTGPNRDEDGPRWRVFDHTPTWARWSVRHPPGL